MCDLSNPIFTDEAKAIEHMEASRWPDGASCPFCGSVNVHKMAGKTQAGMFLCNDCREKFTVRTGTVFERSHIPLHKWLMAMQLMASSKKGISAHQLHRMLNITYKSAWFMAHRIREAMTPAPNAAPLGGTGKIVEADETYLAKSVKTKSAKGYRKAVAVLSLVERGGSVRSMSLESEPDRTEILAALHKHVAPESILHTDGAQFYKFTGLVAEHETVNHNETYVRKGKHGPVHTNTLEGYFSVFKRGMVGTYQHCSKAHLPRYLAEFDFRESNRARLGIDDTMRAERILKGAEGKRLTYRQSLN